MRNAPFLKLTFFSTTQHWQSLIMGWASYDIRRHQYPDEIGLPTARSDKQKKSRARYRSPSRSPGASSDGHKPSTLSGGNGESVTSHPQSIGPQISPTRPEPPREISEFQSQSIGSQISPGFPKRLQQATIRKQRTAPEWRIGPKLRFGRRTALC